MQHWVEGKDYLPWLAGNTLSSAAQDTIDLFATRALCWLLFKLVSTRTFSAKLFSTWAAAAYAGAWGCYSPGAGLFTSRCWNSWGSCQPISPACHGPPGCQHNPLAYQPLLPLMKILNRIGPLMDPWGTLLLTGVQLDFVPLITTLWAQPFSQFLVHCLLIQSILHELLCEDTMGESVKGLTEVKVDDTHCFPLHLPSQSIHHKKSSNRSRITSTCWNYADYSLSPSCHSYAWKWFPGLVVPSTLQELRWCWLACSSLGLTSCPSWRQKWHLFAFSPQTRLPVAMIVQRKSKVTLWGHLPALSALVAGSHEGPWT